jgi:imidazolonepropionase-like amidohydrolase
MAGIRHSQTASLAGRSSGDPRPPATGNTVKRWLFGTIATLVVVGVAFLRPSFSPRKLEPAGRLTIEGVTLVDPTGANANSKVSVEVDGERVVAIHAVNARQRRTGEVIVDGRGKFLIPGLWDMHVHWPAESSLREHYSRLLIGNGVTAVRKMNSGVRRRANGRRDVAWNPSGFEPRAFASGPMVNGMGGLAENSILLASPADVEPALDSLFSAGADFIKVYNGVPREAFFALLRDAARRGKTVAGHVPWSVTAAEASDSGQRSIEHLLGILMSCSAREAELRAELSHAHADRNFTEAMPGQRAEGAALRTYDAARCQRLAQRLAANGTWVVPTLATSAKKAAVGDVAAAQYMPGWQRMNGDREIWWSRRTPAERERLRENYALEQSTVALLRAAGVPLLAGSDMPATMVVPGFSLHDELSLLVDAGLSPRQALQSATVAPARFFGALDSLGTVAPGKVADMVLLDADPLLDIDNTRRIAGVVMRGRYFDRAQLDDMLSESRSFTRRRNIGAQFRSVWCSVANCKRDA